MKAETPATVEELNHAYAEWMKMAPNAPPAELKRVIKLMERRPVGYVSVADGKPVWMHQGTPQSAGRNTFEVELERCRKAGGRTDVYWDGDLGKWRETASR